MAEQKQTYTVLICETDEAAVAQMKQTLEAVEWQIVGVAASENEAVELAQQHKPDMIVMALTLEVEQDGLAATRRILKSQASAVVLLSADTSSTIVKAAVEAGMCGLLTIPLDAERILQTLIAAREVYDLVRESFAAVNRMEEERKAEVERLSLSSLDILFNRAEDALEKVKLGSRGERTKKKMEFIH